MVAVLQARGFWNNTADVLDCPRDLVTRVYRRRDFGIVFEESVDQEHVRSTHPAGSHLDQHLVGLDVWNSYVFEDKWLVIIEYACSFHVLSFAKQFRLWLNSSDFADGRHGCLCHGDILFD